MTDQTTMRHPIAAAIVWSATLYFAWANFGPSLTWTYDIARRVPVLPGILISVVNAASRIRNGESKSPETLKDDFILLMKMVFAMLAFATFMAIRRFKYRAEEDDTQESEQTLESEGKKGGAEQDKAVTPVTSGVGGTRLARHDPQVTELDYALPGARGIRETEICMNEINDQESKVERMCEANSRTRGTTHGGLQTNDFTGANRTNAKADQSPGSKPSLESIAEERSEYERTETSDPHAMKSELYEQLEDAIDLAIASAIEQLQEFYNRHIHRLQQMIANDLATQETKLDEHAILLTSNVEGITSQGKRLRAVEQMIDGLTKRAAQSDQDERKFLDASRIAMALGSRVQDLEDTVQSIEARCQDVETGLGHLKNDTLDMTHWIKALTDDNRRPRVLLKKSSHSSVESATQADGLASKETMTSELFDNRPMDRAPATRNRSFLKDEEDGPANDNLAVLNVSDTMREDVDKVMADIAGLREDVGKLLDADDGFQASIDQFVADFEAIANVVINTNRNTNSDTDSKDSEMIQDLRKRVEALEGVSAVISR